LITVIKLDRKKILLVVLVLLGIAFLMMGFGGLAQRLMGFGNDSLAPTSVMVDPQENSRVDAVGDSAREEAELPDQAVSNDYDQTVEGSYFVDARMSLEQARGKEMETLREVLNSETGEEVRKTAQERLMQLSSRISQEMELENLIRAQGYLDSAVFLDTDTVTVILRPDQDLADETDNRAIAALVAKTTGLSEDSVIVITREN